MAATKNTKAANTVHESENIDATIAVDTVSQKEKKKTARTFSQNDPILCRSVTPGWLGVAGKSGMYYVFSNYGDEAEIERIDIQDIFMIHCL